MTRQSRYRAPAIAARARDHYEAGLFERHKARTTALLEEVRRRIARSSARSDRILKLLRRLRSRLNK